MKSLISVIPGRIRWNCVLLIGVLSGLLQSRSMALTPPSSLDPSFDAQAIVGGVIRAIALQDDGRILVSGRMTIQGEQGATEVRLARVLDDGRLDPSFDLSILSNQDVRAVVSQPDGKVLVATTALVQRLNPDGTLDAGFQPVSVRLDGPVGTSKVIALQPDGKVLIGGARLQRVNADGRPDLTFQSPDDLSDVGTIEIMPDNGLFVIGVGPERYGAVRFHGWLLEPDGTFVASPSVDVGSPVSIQPDGKIISGLLYIARHLPDGQPDPSFYSFRNEFVEAFALQPDGKILFGGRFNVVEGHPCVWVGRLESNGQLDLGFDTSDGFAGIGGVHALALDARGRILVAGELPLYHGALVPPIVRLRGGPSPRVPLRFEPPPFDHKAPIGATVVFSAIPNGYPNPVCQWFHDGVLIPGATNLTLTIANAQFPDSGTYTFAASNSYERIEATALLDLGYFAQPGSLDTSFSDSRWHSYTKLLGVTADGNLLVEDYLADTVELRDPQYGLIKVLAQRIDPASAFELTNRNLMVVQKDVLGYISFRFRRFLPDGSPDPAFVPFDLGGEIELISPMPSGFVYFARKDRDGPTYREMRRLTPLGELDPGYAVPIEGQPLWFQPDEKFVLAPYSADLFSRFNSNGSPDPSFNPPIIPTPLTTVCVQPDNKVLLGLWWSERSPDSKKLVRLMPDGTLDPEFQMPEFFPFVHTPVSCLALQDDGKILVGGNFTFIGGAARRNLARLNPDGTPDFAFAPNDGPDGTVAAMAIEGDQLVILGKYRTVNGIPWQGPARLNLDSVEAPGALVSPTLFRCRLTGNVLQFSSRTATGYVYYLQSTERMPPTTWKTVSSLVGDGYVADWQVQLPEIGAGYFRVSSRRIP